MLSLLTLLLIVIVVFYQPAIAANNPYVITNDRGGNVQDYIRRGQSLVEERRSVVVNGRCASACVLMLNTPELDVCITENAVIGIHRLKWYFKETNTTLYTDPRLPGNEQQWVDNHGGYNADDIKWMNFETAKNFYKVCQN